MKGRPDTENHGEKKTNNALEWLSGRWDEITLFYWNKKGGELDSIHIDFLILLKSGLCLQLQIKTAERAVEKHVNKYPQIPVILVGQEDSVAEVAKKLKI